MSYPQKKYRQDLRCKITFKATNLKVKDKISTTKETSSNIKNSSILQQYNNQNSNQGNQYRNDYNQGHKQQYQQGAKQYQSNQSPQNNAFQGQGQVVNVPIPRIDCGIMIPLQWGTGAVC